jgi:hypothetical protein
VFDPVAIVDDVVGLVAVGDEVRDRERCQPLGGVVESIFRNELHRYAGWPPESTTDGSTVDLCVRTGPRSLDVVGLTYVDFSGRAFPYRAEITRTGPSSLHVALSIGQVDPQTGAVPRLPVGTLVIPVRDDDDRHPVAELIVGRRQVPIVWTKVVDWSSASDR